jgi:actin-related protein
MVVEAIGKTDIDIRRDLFSNIILTGGNSCFRGFVERLQRQLPEIAPPN